MVRRSLKSNVFIYLFHYEQKPYACFTHSSEPSLPEKLMENVDRIWFERGEWRDINEETLQQSIAAMNDDTRSEANDKDINNQSVAGQPSGFDMARVRESVHNKLL